MQFRYISDLHIYDIDSLGWRPSFKDLDAYANNLIVSWNMFTDPEDVVIIAGDLGCYCPKTVEVLKELKGTKILVLGNHDISWGNAVYNCGVFQGVHQSISSGGIYIQHIPEKVANNYTYFIHGHHHRYDTPGMLPALRSYARDTCRLNCASDLNNHRPCTLQELITNKECCIDKYTEMGLLQEV